MTLPSARMKMLFKQQEYMERFFFSDDIQGHSMLSGRGAFFYF